MALPTQVAQQGEAADKAFNPQQAIQEEPTVQPAAASSTVTDTFEHKYKTLQCILAKEQDENRKTVQFMHQEIMNLKNIMTHTDIQICILCLVWTLKLLQEETYGDMIILIV